MLGRRSRPGATSPGCRVEGGDRPPGVRPRRPLPHRAPKRSLKSDPCFFLAHDPSLRWSSSSASRGKSKVPRGEGAVGRPAAPARPRGWPSSATRSSSFSTSPPPVSTVGPAGGMGGGPRAVRRGPHGGPHHSLHGRGPSPGRLGHRHRRGPGGGRWFARHPGRSRPRRDDGAVPAAGRSVGR